MSFSSCQSIVAACVLLAFCISSTQSRIPEPTGFGTKLCKKWPTFTLQDYNPYSRETYLQSYGLGDIQPRAPVTVVGLYYADSNISQEAIRFQEKLYYYMRDHEDVTIQNVAINFYAPKECAMLECEAVWTLEKWWFYTSSCDGYIGGCPPGDDRLQVDNWQGKLSNQTFMPILQDQYWVDAWERFGGGEGDIFVYDSEGRLFAVFCSETHSQFMECTNVYEGSDALDEESYKALKTIVSKAASSSSSDRCENFDDYYYGGYATYYNDDDSTDDDDDDDDDDSDHEPAEGASLTNPNPNPHDDDNDADDDDYYYYYYYDDAPNNRFNLGFHNNHQQPIRKTIPSWMLAGFAAVAVFAATSAILYLRYHRQKMLRQHIMDSHAHSGTTKFSRLATDEEDDRRPGLVDLDRQRQVYGSL